jgi:hypothetical protein
MTATAGLTRRRGGTATAGTRRTPHVVILSEAPHRTAHAPGLRRGTKDLLCTPRGRSNGLAPRLRRLDSSLAATLSERGTRPRSGSFRMTKGGVARPDNPMRSPHRASELAATRPQSLPCADSRARRARSGGVRGALKGRMQPASAGLRRPSGGIHSAGRGPRAGRAGRAPGLAMRLLRGGPETIHPIPSAVPPLRFSGPPGLRARSPVAFLRASAPPRETCRYPGRKHEKAPSRAAEGGLSCVRGAATTRGR